MKPFLLISVFFISVLSMSAEPINAMCPVTPDEPAEPWITTEHEGATIGFCCKSCLRKFNANPSAYLANLNFDTSGGEHAQPHAHNGTARAEDAAHEHGEPGHGEVDGSENEPDGHDHATDHAASEAELGGQVWALLGKLHVLTVHLPIALLPLAGLLEVISLWLNSAAWRFAARLNFIVGASMAIIAAALGWIAASQSNYTGDLAEVLTLHRWLGVSVAGLATIGLAALGLVKFKPQQGLIIYRMIAVTLVVLVPVTAHFGGTLIYGKGYLF